MKRTRADGFMGSYVRNYERSVPRAPQPGVSKALDTLRHRPRAPLADAALNAPSTVPMPPTTSHLEAAVELTEEDQAGTEDPTVEDLAVRVAVRARPLVAKERLERNRECLAYPSPTTVVLGKNRAFHFDEVFGPDSEQTRVYDNLVAPLVDACFDGYNATVLAYGQTGSGKTYTMGSAALSAGADDEIGVIPRVIQDIFAGIRKRRGTSECTVRCAFLEVHNEEVRDLLHPDVTTKKISVRERADGAIVVSGIRECEARTSSEMVRLLENGAVSRTTGGTKMNEQSSRSHAIFTVILEQRHLTREARRRHRGAFSSAKFHLVDLAGSERNKRTGASGRRFKESININSGLLALGNVINAIADDQERRKQDLGPRHLHVPYRDSKLTRLLQDSLGGNSRTCMIACISPADANLEETLNTLKYAARARNIRNKPVVNRDVQQLAAVVDPSTDKAFATGTPSGVDDDEVRALRLAAEGAELELAAARSELAAVSLAANVAEEEAIAARAERDAATVAVERLEHELVGALVVASRLADAGQLTRPGLARIAATAPESAREAAGAAGARIPPVTAADKAAAAVALASPSLRTVVAGDGDDGCESSSFVVVGGDVANDDGPFIANNLRDSSHPTPGRSVIEGYLRELRDLRQTLASRDEDVAEKDAKLSEAREDLERDEAIFAEKMREIKQLRRVVKDAERERADQEERHQREVAALMAAHAAASETLTGLAGPLPPAPPVLPKTPPTTLSAGSRLPHSDTHDGADVHGPSFAVPPAAGSPEPNVEELHAMNEKFAREDAEKERLLREKEQIEREKAKVEEEATQRARQYQAEKRSLERQLRELECNIVSKEELIADLERNEQEAKSLTQRYESRMRALEEEKKAKESEIERLRVELENIDGNVAKGDEEKRRMRDEYEQKVALVQTQLQKLKSERTAGETLRLEKEATKSTAKVRELEGEVTRMKGLQEQLKRRLREREDRHVSAQEQQTNEIAGLRKQSESQNKRIRELEGVKERQRAALKKKTEELAAAQRKLHALGLDEGSQGVINPAHHPGDHSPRSPGHASPFQGSDTPTGGRMGSARGRAHAYSERVRLGKGGPRLRNGTTNTSEGHASTPSSRPTSAVGSTSADVDALRELIDAETSRALRRREGEEELARLEAKRAALARDRDECVKERDQLALKRERARAQMDAERAALTRVLDSLDDAVDAGDITPSKAAELRDRRHAAANRLVTLEAALETNRVLPVDDERLLRELDDRIDGVEADLEYVAEAQAEAAADGRSVASTSRSETTNGNQSSMAPPTNLTTTRGGDAGLTKLIDRIAGMDGREARTALQVALDKVVELRVQERAGQSRVAELEIQLGDAQSAIEEMESGLRMKEMDYDRRVTELQREHLRKEAYLMRLTEAAAAATTTTTHSKHVESTNEPSPGGVAATLFPEPLTPDFGLGTPVAPGSRSLFELKEQQIAVLSNQGEELKEQNRDLRRRVKALLAEREEMEAAGAALERRLESAGRANRSLSEQVERLSDAHRRDGRAFRASPTPSPAGKADDVARGVGSDVVSSHTTPRLPERPGLPRTPGGSAARARRAASPVEVEAARMFPGGYPGAGGSAAGRKKAAGVAGKR